MGVLPVCYTRGMKPSVDVSKFSKEPSFKVTDLEQPITEFALSLGTMKGELWVPGGTAVIVAPGLAMTAKHVLTLGHIKAHGEKPLQGNSELSFSMQAIQIQNTSGGVKGAIWNILKIYGSASTDIAFLELTPFSEEAAKYKWRIPKMNLKPPEVGARIVGFGYSKHQIASKESEVEWSLEGTTIVGEVKNVYREKRDAAMLNFPCFETNVKFTDGMSGGPIFDNEGHLCGLICEHLYEGETDRVDAHSHVVTLWPAVGTEISTEGFGFPRGTSYPFLKLIELGYVTAFNWKPIILGKNSEGQDVVGAPF